MSGELQVKTTKGLKEDQFLNLLGAVEDEGGTLVPGNCTGKKVKYENNIDSFGRPTKAPETTTGCGNESRFTVPLKAVPGRDGGVAEPPAIACAVDDAMHLWPRFKEKVG